MSPGCVPSLTFYERLTHFLNTQRPRRLTLTKVVSWVCPSSLRSLRRLRGRCLGLTSSPPGDSRCPVHSPTPAPSEVVFRPRPRWSSAPVWCPVPPLLRHRGGPSNGLNGVSKTGKPRETRRKKSQGNEERTSTFLYKGSLGRLSGGTPEEDSRGTRVWGSPTEPNAGVWGHPPAYRRRNQSFTRCRRPGSVWSRTPVSREEG